MNRRASYGPVLAVAHVYGEIGSPELPHPFKWAPASSKTGAGIVDVEGWDAFNLQDRVCFLHSLLAKARGWRSLSKLVWAFSFVELTPFEICRSLDEWKANDHPVVLNLIDLRPSEQHIRTIGLTFFGKPEIVVEVGKNSELSALSFAAQVADMTFKGGTFHKGLRLIAEPMRGVVISAENDGAMVAIRIEDLSDLDPNNVA